MSDTIAVPAAELARLNMGETSGQPLCPRCNGGRLHPYRVTMIVPGGLLGLGQPLAGWVAVCVGNANHRRRGRELGGEDLEPEVDACGFSMPMYPVTGNEGAFAAEQVTRRYGQ